MVIEGVKLDLKRMQARKMLTNASYFAFTATPKNKTLEMFGEPLPPDAEGKVKHQPFHSYTMKQAVEEGFILDEIATEGGKTFAIIIDEAHSSQGGKTSAAMSQALSAPAEDEDAGTYRVCPDCGAEAPMDAPLKQAVVTSLGVWRGEALALVTEA